MSVLMRPGHLLLLGVLSVGLILVRARTGLHPPFAPEQSNFRTFLAKGVVREVHADTVVLSHEAIPGFMSAMTMPFRVRERKVLEGLKPGDKIAFRLCVTDTESWIASVVIIGNEPINRDKHGSSINTALNAGNPSALFAYPFTNELGRAVRLADFRGRALAVTFFYTRCPIPDFCPRLSKNFQEASRKLAAIAGGSTNWHFLSISFDPQVDTPQVLKAYGENYQYDPRYWSFLTGPVDKIRELARLSDVTFEQDGPLLNHNFRTLVIDTAGRLQMVFLTGGNLTDQLVAEMLKAASSTNRMSVSTRDPQVLQVN